jgi:hypothetical protein
MNSSASPTEAAPPVRHRWFRRRLVRSLVVVSSIVILLCGGGAWWWTSRPDIGDAVHQAGGRYRREVMGSQISVLIDAINLHSTTVFHWIEFAPGDVDDAWLHAHGDEIRRLSYLILSLRDSRVTGEGLSAMRGMQNLHNLDLSGTPLEDADVAHIATLSNLAQLDVSRTGISDKALVGLSSLSVLAHVTIDSTQATPAGVAGLAACPQLRSVMLVDANDESVRRIAQLNGMIGIMLVGDDITAASLPALKQMQGLQILTLYDCHLTDEEMLELQQALPGCTVQQLSSEVIEQMRESQWEEAE